MLSNPNAAETQLKVAAIHQFIEDNKGSGVGVDGKEFGQGVASIARGDAELDDDIESEGASVGDDVIDSNEGVTEPPRNLEGQGQGQGNQGQGQGNGQGQGQGNGQGNGNQSQGGGG